MQTTREKNAAWLLPESPRLAFGEPPPFGKGGCGVGWHAAWDSLWNKAVFEADPPGQLGVRVAAKTEHSQAAPRTRR